MAHCDLCGVTYLSERGHTCESVSGSTAIGFARATAAINTTHIAQAFPCPDCGQPKVTGSVCDTSRCRARAAPTPAAPAGSGWLTMGDFVAERSFAVVERNATLMRPLSAVEHLAAWIEEAVAQRARAEAAERERDEARDAATAREAGLRKDAERWRYVRDWYTWLRRSADIGSDERGNPLTELRTYFEVRVPNGSNLSCAAMLDHAIDAAPASLAAPEGGTSRPTPPEGT